MMKTHPEYHYVLFLPAFLLCFFLVERLVPADCEYWVSYCPLDDRIPFAEAFIVPYCLWYPLLFAVGIYLLLRDVPELKRYVLFMSIGFGFSLLFCLLFPNGQDLRPAQFPRENVFTWLCGRIYAADTNTNVLPSMHVIGCIAASVAARRSVGLRRRWSWAVITLSLLICLSTVFVKQHSVLDIAAGAVVCLPLWWGIYRRKDRKKTKKEKLG